MSEKKEYTVAVESVYTEVYYLQGVEDDEEITLELLEKKGEFEETQGWQRFVKIIDVEEVEEDPGFAPLVFNVGNAAQAFKGDKNES